jgi:hypothetical protein
MAPRRPWSTSASGAASRAAVPPAKAGHGSWGASMYVAPARQVAQTMRKAASKWYAVAARCGPTHPVGVRVSAECLRSRQTGAPRRACTRRLSDGLRLANGVGLLVQAICGEFRRRPQLPPASDVLLSPPPSRRPRRPAAVSAQSRRKRGGVLPIYRLETY